MEIPRMINFQRKKSNHCPVAMGTAFSAKFELDPGVKNTAF